MVDRMVDRMVTKSKPGPVHAVLYVPALRNHDGHNLESTTTGSGDDALLDCITCHVRVADIRLAPIRPLVER